MNEFVKNIIEEAFKSKKQQKYFFAKANDKTLSSKERGKWKKMSSEFSDETDFKKLKNDVEGDVDEIVDEKGNLMTSKMPSNLATKGVTQKKTTDDVVKTGTGMMGSYGRGSTSRTFLRFWGESDMSKALGFDETMGKDKDKEDAEDYFQDELGMDEPESKERLQQYGYDKKLPGDKVRLIENPRKYVQDYVESIISKKTNPDELVKNDHMETEINPIVKKQIGSLKNTLEKNNLSLKDIIHLFNKNE